MKTTKTLHGPNGIRIELDRAQVIPEDPGAGTPAVVYLGNASATYYCAADTGELECGEVQLSHKQCAWLARMGDEVEEFLHPETTDRCPECGEYSEDGLFCARCTVCRRPCLDPGDACGTCAVRREN